MRIHALYFYKGFKVICFSFLYVYECQPSQARHKKLKKIQSRSIYCSGKLFQSGLYYIHDIHGLFYLLAVYLWQQHCWHKIKTRSRISEILGANFELPYWFSGLDDQRKKRLQVLGKIEWKVSSVCSVWFGDDWQNRGDWETILKVSLQGFVAV